jgi:outer membrane protein W
MLSVGKNMNSNFSLAGEFGYNSLNQSLGYYGQFYRTVNQYTFGATARYTMPLGNFRPNIGATLDYVRRSYSNLDETTYGEGIPTGYGATSSNSIDYGFVAGVDYKMTEHMSLGIDYRYMMNLTYEYDNQSYMNTANTDFDNPGLENRNYQVWAATLRYTY